MSAWQDVEQLLKEAKADNERIGELEYKLGTATNLLEAANRLLHRANAENAMLLARLERGNGIDKDVLQSLMLLLLDAVVAGRIKLNLKHVDALRKITGV